jgi:hypothetical protein
VKTAKDVGALMVVFGRVWAAFIIVWWAVVLNGPDVVVETAFSQTALMWLASGFLGALLGLGRMD